MSFKKTGNSHSSGGVLIHVNLTGLIIFSVALVATAASVTYGLVAARVQGNIEKAAALRGTLQNNASKNPIMEQKTPPPWGQFVMREIDLEQPEEYLAYGATINKVETWTFEGMNSGEVRSLLQSCGLAANEVERALSPPLLSVENSNTVVTPDAELVFSLTPQTRAKLYSALARCGMNQLMRFPFCFVGDNFNAKFGNGQFRDAIVSSLRKLLYPRGDVEIFSDLGILLRQAPDENERVRLLKALSCQSAVMLRICIWPDTDLDKLVGYWNRGLQAKDIRPLLESFQRMPEGASVSILYFLPQFARQHLYTFPRPAQPNDPVMDCHWTTMNFFNETPDNRFSDPEYTVAYLQTNYYKIAKPTAYGDLVFLLNKDGNAIHSAVFLADDIVFTKNGNNYTQPWMLMHLKDLLGEFTTDTVPEIAVYRNKNW